MDMHVCILHVCVIVMLSIRTCVLTVHTYMCMHVSLQLSSSVETIN